MVIVCEVMVLMLCVLLVYLRVFVLLLCVVWYISRLVNWRSSSAMSVVVSVSSTRVAKFFVMFLL